MSTPEETPLPSPNIIHRTGARVLVRDSTGAILLIKTGDPHVPGDEYWVTPGGGLDEGETWAEAAARELREEAGLEILELGEHVRQDVVEFSFKGSRYRQPQRWYAIEIAEDAGGFDLDTTGWTDLEREAQSGYRWWRIAEIESTDETMYPSDLADLVRSIKVWGSARRPETMS